MNMMQPMLDNVVQLRDEAEGFPLTLAACKKADLSNWDIGDALIAECGPPIEIGVWNGSCEKIEAASTYLASQGFYYKPKTLKHFRKTAHSFHHTTRVASVSFSIHQAALSPETLNACIKANSGVKITREMVEEYRRIPQVQAEHAMIKRVEAAKKAKAPEPQAVNPVRPTQPHRDGCLYGLPRADEIAPLYTSGRGRTMVAQAAKNRGGKEIWSLILQAKDAGFIGRETNPSSPNIKLLFPDAPPGWVKNYLLTDPNHRAFIRDELMPAAIANKDAIIAEPEKIEIILRDHFTRQKTVAKKAVEGKKLVIARETTEHDDVVVFGKRYWPIVDKSQFDYDFEQLAAAFWFFNEMHCMAGANGTSPGACAHGIRFAIGRLQQYVTDQDMNSPVRTNMRRLLNVVISLANALEENPDGECIRPPLPR